MIPVLDSKVEVSFTGKVEQVERSIFDGIVYIKVRGDNGTYAYLTEDQIVAK